MSQLKSVLSIDCFRLFRQCNVTRVVLRIDSFCSFRQYNVTHVVCLVLYICVPNHSEIFSPIQVPYWKKACDFTKWMK